MNHPTFQFFSYGVFMLSEKTVFRQESKCLRKGEEGESEIEWGGGVGWMEEKLL